MGTMLIKAGRGITTNTPAYENMYPAEMRNITRRSKTNVTLWIVQGLLALLFLFAGSVKLVLPVELLTQQFPLPGLFLKFIGLCEVLGALGLILPGLLRIRPSLTTLAAAGLVIEMIGATVVTLAFGGGASALAPFVVGSFAGLIVYGRRRIAPLVGS